MKAQRLRLSLGAVLVVFALFLGFVILLYAEPNPDCSATCNVSRGCGIGIPPVSCSLSDMRTATCETLGDDCVKCYGIKCDYTN